MTSETILPIGEGRQLSFKTIRGAIMISRRRRRSNGSWAEDCGLLIKLGEVRSVAAVLERLAGELEKRLVA